jgi:hypothetical protein
MCCVGEIVKKVRMRLSSDPILAPGTHIFYVINRLTRDLGRACAWKPPENFRFFFASPVSFGLE